MAMIAVDAYLYFFWDGPEADEVFVDEWMELGFIGACILLFALGVGLVVAGVITTAT